MAADIKPAPRLAPTPTSMAAKANSDRNHWREPPVVENVNGTLDDIGCLLERLRSLHDSATYDLGDALSDLRAHPDAVLLNNLWHIFILAGEKLEEVHELINATTSKAYADAQAMKVAA